MRILLLSDLNSIHTKKWVTGLLDRGCELMVFGLSEPTDDFYDNLNVAIAYANIKDARHRSLFSKLGYLSKIKEVKKAYRKFRPDIVHAHYATSYGLLGSFLKHTPYLISVWGTEIFDFPKASMLNRLILKRNLAKADFLYSTSLRMAEETKLYTSKVVDVVPFGVDVSRFQPGTFNENANTITIGIIKTLEKNYAIDDLIKAFGILVQKHADKTFNLLIAGEGSQRQMLEALVEELKLSDRVIFLGFVKHHEVPATFAKMDIAVISSLAESFGVSAVEAAACSLPVVATRVGGLPEVVKDGETGLLCEPANPEDLAAKLSLLIEDDDLRKKMGNAGRHFVLTHYDWEKNVDTMFAHYQAVLAND